MKLFKINGENQATESELTEVEFVLDLQWTSKRKSFRFIGNIFGVGLGALDQTKKEKPKGFSLWSHLGLPRLRSA